MFVNGRAATAGKAGKAGKGWSLPRFWVFIRALIRNNRSKNFGVEYWTLPGSNSPWRLWMDYTALVSVLYFFKIDNLSYLLHILAFFTVCVLLFFSSSFFASTFFDRYILLQATGNERRSWKAWGLDYTWGRLCRRRRRTAMPATTPHCYWALGPPATATRCPDSLCL